MPGRLARGHGARLIEQHCQRQRAISPGLAKLKLPHIPLGQESSIASGSTLYGPFPPPSTPAHRASAQHRRTRFCSARAGSLGRKGPGGKPGETRPCVSGWTKPAPPLCTGRAGRAGSQKRPEDQAGTHRTSPEPGTGATDRNRKSQITLSAPAIWASSTDYDRGPRGPPFPHPDRTRPSNAGPAGARGRQQQVHARRKVDARFRKWCLSLPTSMGKAWSERRPGFIPGHARQDPAVMFPRRHIRAGKRREEREKKTRPRARGWVGPARDQRPHSTGRNHSRAPGMKRAGGPPGAAQESIPEQQMVIRRGSARRHSYTSSGVHPRPPAQNLGGQLTKAWPGGPSARQQGPGSSGRRTWVRDESG